MHLPQMGYDRAITVFSPDGRLFQVEYAREAVKRGATAIGIKCKEGVILIADKRVGSKLLEADTIEKIYKIDEHICAATSGLVADARVLIDRARIEAQINRLTYDEPITVKELAKKICDFKQQYTQYGGVRPFGVSLLIAGVDEVPKLYETDPSGALLEYKATAIGMGRNAVTEFFEKEYRDDLSFDDAMVLGLVAMGLSIESELVPENIEVGYVKVDDRTFKEVSPEELKPYVERANERIRELLKK
ncbi:MULTISPECIES: archaeal proteasome endopeptidase complex subunit alpha [Archaeoglobus]|uniref:Proteasome subunit alpha n=3 Tax=Archaeoglobus fulgidus TaxID=2234 RepID=PSA_ARCFU|nr:MULTISPECIES: archaeal proteasome endopeptidase complex subunit alpha [Archaeoglobus]O29760.1 RecName: Full=Proteasome subunit alpha; AltName: Full=20S proteasome alpha subunit; AltName: Full=Proteasome core protein PsmA [Archaeoglobus fulgidus DSM 4304]AAB90747.1 proteasome, subunit alpha (psmA) [Archaeoglobus fulgidus DSM 4304]AIG97306.1 proteasome endopeptidase complex, archaeal, alpha subunit [Archaeoglobus fulgidus DSM 8774]KUJ93734.1 MAG: Proteasome subunit alpha [Archaeoglobus fulgidu